MSDNTLVNAVIGGVVTILTSFIPLSPLVGGGVAAYLEGGSRGDAARVGALSGLVASVPLIFLVLFALLFVMVDFGFTLVIALGLFFVLGGYAIGLGALGGYLTAVLLENR